MATQEVLENFCFYFRGSVGTRMDLFTGVMASSVVCRKVCKKKCYIFYLSQNSEILTMLDKIPRINMHVCMLKKNVSNQEFSISVKVQMYYIVKSYSRGNNPTCSMFSNVMNLTNCNDEIDKVFNLSCFEIKT